MIFENSPKGIKVSSFNTVARKVADVSGAGDTVISTLAVLLSVGATMEQAVMIANFAAGLVVEEVGIVPIYKEKLLKHIQKHLNNK
jgi:bifunctional ADP-heptose synthase (sugar kinase/adenylyltransferase)